MCDMLRMLLAVVTFRLAVLVPFLIGLYSQLQTSHQASSVNDTPVGSRFHVLIPHPSTSTGESLVYSYPFPKSSKIPWGPDGEIM